jgi:mRNA interferase RelE/StbE
VAQKEIWKIVLTRPAEKAYNKAPRDIKQRLDSCFDDIEQNPLHGNNIRPLTGKLKGLLRYRIGDWRVIYRIDRDNQSIEIIAILPRGDAYK